MVKMRDEIAKDDRWDVDSFYPSLEAWEQEFLAVKGRDAKPRWPSLAAFQGHLGESSQAVKAALEELFRLDRAVSKLYAYSHLRHDEDLTHEAHKIAYQKISALNHDLAQEASWIEPELLALPQDTLDRYLQDAVLADYRFYLEKMIRLKKHTLSAREEELLTLANKPLAALHRAFSVLENADFKFGTVTDAKGESHELTHGSYQLYLRSPDRILRANAMSQLHQKFADYENTLCELLQGEMQSHWFSAQAHHFSSSLEAALFPKQIDTKVYHSLIQAVRSRIQSLHRYVALRKRVMKVDQLHLYDMYVPLVPAAEMRMNYDEAERIVVESVAPLGKEYQEMLRRGLLEDRWVDRYENLNKRSGAYSSGCYDSHPYILMNFKGLLHDTLTLAHEAGHSMHSFLSWRHQPYHYSQYPIFVAEVASTFNEELLMKMLMQRTKTPGERIFLINQKIEDIRATLFRQTMFAEFELFVHEKVEKDEPLTPALLKQKYRELNAFYFGPEVVIDAAIDIEWARIPHFYYNFYVYQYATGISAALTLAHRVLEGDEQARKNYLAFLQGGGSRYPIDLLKVAGVDMTSAEPVMEAINTFDQLVIQLETLLF